jgi:hypothetical protein
MDKKKAPRSLFARTDRTAHPSESPKKDEAKAKTAPQKDAALSQPKSIGAQARASAKDSERKSQTPQVRATPVVAKSDAQQLTVPPTQQQRQTLALNVSHLRDSFESQSANRVDWKESDYSELILKLDRLQTEAFILKGKLLSEAKRRFFESNKQGWAEFCGDRLGMNYTTANQYIRVATEFDVTSHQYPHLSFEHFKALLPVAPTERLDLLSSFQGASVKALRNAVQSHVQKAEGPRPTDRSLQNARQMLKVLQSVHSIMSTIDTSALSQQLRWQLSAACSQVASQLLQFSNRTNEAFIQEEALRPAQQMGASGFDTAQR